MEIALIGLQNAGKSSLVTVLATDSFEATNVPTVGFNMKKVQKGGVLIKMWDMGGQPRFRPLWERYCRGVQAIVFVVDAADESAIESSKVELHALMDKPSLAGTPLLILGNKNDLVGALDGPRLIERMDLKSIKEREVCVYSVSCKQQRNIDITLMWLTKHAK